VTLQTIGKSHPEAALTFPEEAAANTDIERRAA